MAQTKSFAHVAIQLILLASGAPAMAQSAGAAAQESPTPSLQEVVVTARKREEKLLEVPAPVSVITAETIEVTEAVRLDDYLTQVPGVSFDTLRAGQTNVTFRGINVGDGNATVITYIDNIPLTPNGPGTSSAYLTPDLDPSDIAQIEVDRGPQGTLYGANAIGGVLKYVTVKPDPNTFSGRIEVSGESVEHGGVGGGVRGAVNIPLIADTLGLRLSAYDRDDPGYIDDPLLNEKNLNNVHVSGGRAALLWNATDSLSINLSSMVQLMRSNGNDFVDIDPLTSQPLYGDLTQEAALRKQWFSSRNAVYNVDVQWDLKWARLLSSTSYSTLENGSDTDNTPAYGPLLSAAFGIPNVGLDSPLTVRAKRVSEELRLTSSDHDKLEWQIGAYYTRARTESDQGADLFDTNTQAFITIYGTPLFGYLKNQYVEHSGFGNIDYHFTPQFDVSLGARYSTDDQRLDSYFEGLLFGPTVDSQTYDTEHAVTWAVNPRYKLSEDQMVYARVATGYRPGGADLVLPGAIAAGLSPTYNHDQLISYETGWKSSWFDHHVTMDVSVYYVRWTDLQELVTLADFSYTTNGGYAHSQGVETAFTWLPMTGLNLTANITYNDNRLDSDPQNNPDLSEAGNRLPTTPRFSGNFSADYNWTITPSDKAFVGASVYFTTARPNELSIGYDPNHASGVGVMPNFGLAPIYNPNTNAIIGYAQMALPGYATLDLRAGLEHGLWTVEAYAKNVTDVRAYSEFDAYNSASYSNYATEWVATVLRPRTVGMSIARKF
jgi:outer membrane receptor protein involved in Fe transport